MYQCPYCQSMKTSELMQSVIVAAPHAERYFSDAFNTYREQCWWGEYHSKKFPVD